MSSTRFVSGLLKGAMDEATGLVRDRFSGIKWRHRLLTETPSGDGRPVLLISGFGTTASYLDTLHDFLKDKGYAVHAAPPGRNLGPHSDFGRALGPHLQEAHDRYARVRGYPVPVSLVGYSLGGLMALDLAHSHPGLVGRVITLGSPLQIAGFKDQEALARRPVSRAVGAVYRRLDRKGAPELHDAAFQKRLVSLPAVPVTTIFSGQDAVVDRRWSLLPESPISENLEVEASHAGLPFHPAAFLIIAQQLSQNPAAWRKFDPSAHSQKFGRVAVVTEGLPQNDAAAPTTPIISLAAYRR